jgi:predicted transcriptional regulator
VPLDDLSELESSTRKTWNDSLDNKKTEWTSKISTKNTENINAYTNKEKDINAALKPLFEEKTTLESDIDDLQDAIFDQISILMEELPI